MRSLCFAFVVVVGACSAGGAAQTMPTGVVPTYVAIATALADDKLEPVAGLAKSLEQEAGKEAGKPGIDRLVTASKALGGGDIETTRRAFKNASDAIIETMRADASLQSGYVMVHCPMAFEDKGALWVQAEGKVANPYYGASMLRCGTKLAWDAELPKTAEL